MKPKGKKKTAISRALGELSRLPMSQVSKTPTSVVGQGRGELLCTPAQLYAALMPIPLFSSGLPPSD